MFRFKICERRIIKTEVLNSLEFYTVSYLLNDNSRQPLLVVKFAIVMGLERENEYHIFLRSRCFLTHKTTFPVLMLTVDWTLLKINVKLVYNQQKLSHKFSCMHSGGPMPLIGTEELIFVPWCPRFKISMT